MLARGDRVTQRAPAGATGVSALDARFETLRPRLTGMAAGLVGRDAAEDVVQDAYLRARARVGQIHDRGALDAWLTRIVIRTAYNHHRRRAGLLARMPLLAARQAPAERDPGLRELIEHLPARQRVVLVLHYAHGYSLSEVADLIGTSHANARQLASRARRRLAAAWEPDR